MLKRNLIANYVGQGWIALMTFVFIPLYIKYLGIEAYGLIGVFNVIQAWLVLLDMGMTPTLSREMARFMAGEDPPEYIRDLLRSIECVVLWIALLAGGSVALAANWIASHWLQVRDLPLEDVAQAFALMGLVVLLRFFEGIYRSSLVGLQRQVLLNVINSGMATLRGFGAVGVLAWFAPTIQAFFLWQGFVSLLGAFVLSAATYMTLPKGIRKGRFSIEALRPVWTFAQGMLKITLLSLLLTQVDKLLLSKLLPLREFGYYMLAVSLAGTLYYLVNPITQAWYPRLCQLYAHDDQSALATVYHQGAQLVSVTAGSAGMVLILFSEPILFLWTQDPELTQRVAPFLSIIVAGNMLHSFMHIPYQAQLAHGWTNLAVWVNAVGVLFIIPAILWGVPRYGALAAAWIWVSLCVGYVFIGAQLMYRRILMTEKWKWYLMDLLLPLSAGFSMALCIKYLAVHIEATMPPRYYAFAQLSVATIATLSATAMASSTMRQRLKKMVVGQFC